MKHWKICRLRRGNVQKTNRQSKCKGGKQDSCINPVEAARFRKAMRDEVLVLEKAVRKGTNIAETYLNHGYTHNSSL